MSLRVLLLVGAALVFAAPATAKERVVKHKHKQVERTCVCTMGHGEAMAPMAPMPPIPAMPAMPAVPHHGKWKMQMGQGAGPNVMVFRDGDDERVVIVRKHRKHRDSADQNNDGEVSRREFIRRAEKHFKERDRDGDGKLEDDEMEPMSYEFPIPPEPPEAPEPPEPDDE